MSYTIVPVYNYPESNYSVALGNVIVRMTTRYNYAAECWVLDIADYEETPILSGIMLVPDVDLLKAYPAITDIIGKLKLVERYTGAYKEPESLGVDAKLLWYAPGTDVT